MSYNLKCCSFYPNNFDASALKGTVRSSYSDRGTCVPRPRYMCTPTEVHAYPDRDAMTFLKQSGQTHQIELPVNSLSK